MAEHDDRSETTGPVLRVEGLVTRFGDHVVHDGVDLTLERGEIMGLVGGSGSGKSVLLRCATGLMRPAAGTIEVEGRDITRLSRRQAHDMKRRWGVLFQGGALFSSLTVLQNVEAPLREHYDLSEALYCQLASLKIAMVGLEPQAAQRYPAELSGGMRKRAGLARALALDAKLLFLDEPTAGLDPIGANAFDELLLQLRDALGLSVLLITHDLDTLGRVCDRVGALVDKRVKLGTLEEIRRDPHPWIQDYFTGPRGRAARTAEGGA